MSFYKICHDTAHYDLVCDRGIHRCSVCGSKWYCVIPPPPKQGGKYEPPYWVEGWSFRRFLRNLLNN